jgi:hypothetical protein
MILQSRIPSAPNDKPAHAPPNTASKPTGLRKAKVFTPSRQEENAQPENLIDHMIPSKRNRPTSAFPTNEFLA